MAAIYQAEIYCDDCADEIRHGIEERGEAPADPKDETSYDSDVYPKNCGDDDESDTPQHCGCGEHCLNAVELEKDVLVGVLIGTNLTSAGVRYVKEYIANDPDKKNPVTQYWVEQFKDYLD